ncbi:MAG TPA: hypothetical protein VE398_05765 [Acidobacteriota bacterium]|nr:hypothetical protein [Acidobacteriota bacterium]
MRILTHVSLILALLCPVAADTLAQAPGEATIPDGTRITLQLNEHLSTKLNSEGDSFTAVVSVPVLLGNRIAIPKGSTVYGSISRVVRPGRFKGKAIMTLNFQSIRIPGRGQFPVVASLASVDSEGNPDVKTEGTIKGGGNVGGDVGRVAKPALGGAGIGAIAGGAKGSAIGAGAGAMVGIITVFATRGKDLEIARGSTMNIALDRALILPAEPSEAAAGPKNR